MEDVLSLPATELAHAIRSRRVSPVELVDAVLNRIEERADLNAFVTVSHQEAREAARKAEKAVVEGAQLAALHGLPFSVKDSILTKGMRTTFGSATMANFVPDRDAVPVARAKHAGGILIGKTTTPEFEHKIHTSTVDGGLTLNPYHPGVTCGGSSGGAAVAIATGMGPLALGTDGGGSVRIPASCCGVVGLKPTLGRIPDPDAPDLFAGTSHIGPMARDVESTRLLFAAIEGFTSEDPYGQAALPPARHCEDMRGLRVAWMPRCGNKVVDEDVARLSRDAVAQMDAMGASVDEIELDFAGLEPTFFVFMETKVYRMLAPHIDSFRDCIDPTILPHFENGSRYTARDYVDALAVRSEMFKKVQSVFASFDVIASPTAAAPPLPHEQDPHGRLTIHGQQVGRVRQSWYPYTLGFNMTGNPAISIPCGLTPSGLPVGFQLAGKWYDEELLFDVARLTERALNFKPKSFGRAQS
jgi:aspartyl-tRNA(Asn)/glutamyl-tRNA(Gln) amidotransferase subunit A